MENNAEPNTRQIVPTASAILEDDTIVEMTFQTGQRRTFFAIYNAGRWTLQDRIDLGSEARLVPFSPNNLEWSMGMSRKSSATFQLFFWHEAVDKAEEFLKERPLSTYYDEVALPGLKLAGAVPSRSSETIRGERNGKELVAQWPSLM